MKTFKAVQHTIPFIFVLVVSVLSSCQRVVDIDLNETEAQIVIEASLDNQNNYCSVSLTRTVNFNQTNSFPNISGASVILSDGQNSDTLIEDSPGHYSTTNIAGVPGTTYELLVIANNESYSALSTMPQPIDIDTVYMETVEGLFWHDDEDYIRAEFYDPAGVDNFYRYNVIINNNDINLTTIANDEINDGELIGRNLYSNLNDDYEEQLFSGDSATVFLYTIDENVFNYYRTLNDLTGAYAAAAPANPQTNFTNGALGFFSAHAFTTYSIIVP